MKSLWGWGLAFVLVMATWGTWAHRRAATPPIVDPFRPAPTAPVIVDRGTFGGCPSGYVDHPSDPKRCVLPLAAAQALGRAARR
jgi:hypothetical protein